MSGSDVYSKDPDKKSSAICSMFSKIAPRYDLLNSILSLSFHKRWRRFAVKLAGVGVGDRAVDVCCGTGDFAFDLAHAVSEQGQVQAVDFCEPMLDIARKKALRYGVNNVSFLNADALSMPFQENSFQCASIGFGLRNITKPVDALKEINRVLAPGGRLVCLEASIVRYRLVSPVWRVYFYRIAPLVARLFGGDVGAYRYLPDSVAAFYSREELSRMLESAGFVNISYKDLMLGAACIHLAEKPK